MPVRVPIPSLSASAATERVLDGETSRYLVRVLRLAPGDTFIAFDPDARTEADAAIVEAHPQKARVRIEAARAPAVVARAPLAVVYALAKGDKIDAVVRDATELGATHVILARTARSVVKLDGGDGARHRLESKLDRWRRIAEQAARQCGRSDPPSIEGVLDWTDALERAGVCEARFCLDPRATEPLGPALSAAATRGASIAFAIGPEGGLSADEVETAIGKGFAPASLGPFILRTETVAAAVLGTVRVLLSGAPT